MKEKSNYNIKNIHIDLLHTFAIYIYQNKYSINHRTQLNNKIIQ